MHVTKKRVAVVAAVAALGVGVSGTALGWWSSAGNGAGSATTGTSTDFVVTADNVALGDLTPGGPSDTVSFTVHNPSTGHQHVSSVVVSVAKANGDPWTVVDGSNHVICSAADFSIAGGVAGVAKTFSPNADLAPENAGSSDDYTNSVTVQMVNADSNQDGCQNVTVPLYVAAS